MSLLKCFCICFLHRYRFCRSLSSVVIPIGQYLKKCMLKKAWMLSENYRQAFVRFIAREVARKTTGILEHIVKSIITLSKLREDFGDNGDKRRLRWRQFVFRRSPFGFIWPSLSPNGNLIPHSQRPFANGTIFWNRSHTDHLGVIFITSSQDPSLRLSPNPSSALPRICCKFSDKDA